jgi:hypothetical protein
MDSTPIKLHDYDEEHEPKIVYLTTYRSGISIKGDDGENGEAPTWEVFLEHHEGKLKLYVHPDSASVDNDPFIKIGLPHPTEDGHYFDFTEGTDHHPKILIFGAGRLTVKNKLTDL